MLEVIHKGVKLNQTQLDALVPVINDYMHGKIKGKKSLDAAIDKALENAGFVIELKPDKIKNPAISNGEDLR